jgi:hypothetical protein
VNCDKADCETEGKKGRYLRMGDHATSVWARPAYLCDKHAKQPSLWGLFAPEEVEK